MTRPTTAAMIAAMHERKISWWPFGLAVLGTVLLLNTVLFAMMPRVKMDPSGFVYAERLTVIDTNSRHPITNDDTKAFVSNTITDRGWYFRAAYDCPDGWSVVTASEKAGHDIPYGMMLVRDPGDTDPSLRRIEIAIWPIGVYDPPDTMAECAEAISDLISFIEYEEGDVGGYSEVLVEERSNGVVAYPRRIFEDRFTFFNSRIITYFVFGDGWALCVSTSLKKKEQGHLEDQIFSDCRSVAESIQVIP